MNIRSAMLGLACVAGLMASGAQAANYKFATNTTADVGPGALIQEFADEVREKTDGRVKIKVFANGVLGSQTDYLQQIQKGVVDLGLVNSATLENIIPEFSVVNLPYMFRTLDEYGKVMGNADIQQMLFETAKDHRFVPLGFLSNGFRSLSLLKPVNKMADLKGMKIRTMSSETYVRMYTLFGAVPTPMAFGDTFPALQQGVIDGAGGSLSGLYDLNYGQATKYAARTEHTRLTDFIVVSDKFRNSLSDEDLKIVKDELNKISMKSLKVIDSAFAASEQKGVEKFGVTVVDVDKAPFMAAVQPMYDDAAKDPKKLKLLEKIFELEGRELK
ncbi:TRAP transporter substrate-binding protein DctP [uncultured Cohaesibacter sp.]|uniref:TRAP transporter substrate-binding protein DctP n=1 Tax=uncultured Cohaesibacter sp. TaxID=1002546 RepID=UPI002A0A9DAC|nr:TRAP transporter substrate-binding protein DctP [uncultured Cohaesibacter sp.]